MTTVREPRLEPVAILDLRPTQITVGMREVKAKRKHWRDESKKKGEEFLGKHMIPVILGAIRSSSKTTGPVAAEFADAQGSGAIDLFLLFGFLVGVWAVPRFGRIHMQVIGFVGMTLGMLILVAPEVAAGGAAAHVWLVFAGFILFNLAMNAGPNATTFALAPELFPTKIRASAGGFAAATAKVGATLGIFVLPQVKAHGGVAAVLIMMAIVSGLGAAVTAILAREVGEIPEGRSIDEAEAL